MTMCDDFKALINEGKDSLIQYLESPGGEEIFNVIQYAVNRLCSDDVIFQKPQYVPPYLFSKYM
jgi:hypothetical protein